MKFELKSKFNNFIYLLLALLFICTAVNVGLNFADSGDSDLSNIAVAADQPTNTKYYWTDTEAQTEQGVDFTNYTLSGSASKTDPYLIQSETDLAFLSWTIYTDNAYNNHVSSSYYYSNIYFKQTTNLDLSAYYWQPIGIYFTRDGTTTQRYFSGNYDGGGYTVSGVFTPAGSRNAYSYQGLFGYIQGRSSTRQASITNVGVIDSFVQGNTDVGGVVGYAYSNATVSNVYNTGIVSGSSRVGGVVGRAYSNTTISNAYNTGSVSGSSSVGGVVGSTSSSVTVRNAYNTGSVSGSSNVGGVVGSAYSNATVSNTYYGGDCTLVVGIGSGEGSAIKIDSLVEEWAKNEEWYSAYATLEDGSLVWNLAFPWDFDFTWYIDSTQNEGYPVLYTDQNRPEIHYWIDEYVQTEQGVDFTNYTLSGSGSGEDPYLIQSETDLAFLSWTIYTGNAYNNHVSSSYYYSDIYFKQTTNLNLSAYYWQPIGIYYIRSGTSASRYFSGNYDGGGYTVSGVFTPAGSSNGYSYQGLFGYVAGRSLTQQASISNLGVIDSFVQGNRSVGGVVGGASSYYATITNVYNTGIVSGDSWIGGVVGYAGDSTVSNVYNTGSVSGSSSKVGGVVGNMDGATVSNVYNTGLVIGIEDYVGGVVGYASGGSTVSNVYYGGACTLDVGIGSGSGSATKIDNPVEEWAKNEEWYRVDATGEDGALVWNVTNAWDFNFVWDIDSEQNDGYPILNIKESYYWIDEYAQTEKGVDFTSYTLSGSGSKTDPYLIQSETDLAFLSWTIYTGNAYNNHVPSSYYYYYSDIYFKQTTNLNLSAYYWQPIGIYYTRSGTTARRYFSGNYDGGGHAVSGVFTPAGSSNGYSYQGLFGYVRGISSTQQASIANLGVIDSFVQGYESVGGVVGYAGSYATISNVYNTGIVSGSSSNVGGVVGYAFRTVSNAYNTGIVSGSSSNVGGVVGYASRTVSNAYNTGSVSGSSNVGGVVGNASSSSTTITNVYNTGIVSGSSSYVGGVVGYAYYATISNAYNTGSVSGSSYVGGVVGGAHGTVSNAYNIGSVSGNQRVGGVVGRAGSATISDCGVECAVITGTSNVGVFVGQNASSSATIENCYAIVDGDLSPYGSNSGTVTNCLWIAGGVKYYLGTDFSGFAWLNTDSCPIPKGLSWMGQFWTEDITSQITSSSDWTEWVA